MTLRLILLLLGIMIYAQQSHPLDVSNTIGMLENKGQIVDQFGAAQHQVNFLIESSEMNIQLRKDGFSYDFYEKDYPTEFHENKFPNWKEIEQKLKVKYHRVDFIFEGFNLNYTIETYDEQKEVYNYYRPDQTFLNVKKFKKVVYKNFYPNIDLLFKIQDGERFFEYDFIVHPGGKLDDIRFRISEQGTQLVDNDKIKITTSFGELNEFIPKSFLVSHHNEIEVKVNYKLHPNGTFGFDSKEHINLDTGETLWVDPTPIRKWGTYFGNYPNDFTVNKIIAKNEKLIGVGSTDLVGVATSGVHQGSFNGGLDGALFQLSEDGQLDWFTYFGGSSLDTFYDVKIDDADKLILVGLSGSSGLATSGVHQQTKNSYYDGLITKFNLNGTRIWTTYFGGEYYDELYAVSIDNNAIYVGGGTGSHTNISTPGSFQETKGSDDDFYDGYLGRFTPNGQLVWSSYFGGVGADGIQDISSDSQGDLIFAGSTASTNNIAFGDVALLNPPDQNNAFILKVNPNGTPIWSTYVGGEKREQLFSVEVDSEDNIVVAGDTFSTTGISTTGSHQTNFLPQNSSLYIKSGFIQKYTTTGHLIWGTYFTGNQEEVIADLTLNELNDIYICGTAKSSTHISTDNAYSENLKGNGDAFISKFSSDGILDWSTYYGGIWLDTGRSLAVEGDFVYLAGKTTSATEVATPNTYQVTKVNGFAGYFAKFKECETSAKITMEGTLCSTGEVTLTVSGGISYEWYTIDGFLSNSVNINVPVTENEVEYFVYVENGECSEVLSYMVHQITSGDIIFDTPELPAIQAYCSVLLVPPTGSDPCDGQITATSGNPLLFDIPGYTLLIWEYENSFGDYYEQFQEIEILSADEIFTQAIEINYCESNAINLLEEMPVRDDLFGFEFSFYESQDDIDNNIPIQNISAYNNPNQLNSIFIVASRDDCSDTEIINLQALSAPEVHQISAEICDANNDGIEIVDLNNFIPQITNPQHIVSFYFDENHTMEITDLNFELLAQTIVYVVVSNGGCDNYTTLHLNLNSVEERALPNLTMCDESSGELIANFDFTEIQMEIANLADTETQNIQFFINYEDALNLQNPLSINYQNTSSPQTIYAIDTTATCPKIYVFDLIVTPLPDFNPQGLYHMCEGSSITLSVGTDYDTYLWSTGETTSSIEVDEPGFYEITVTLNSCSITKVIEVQESDDIFIQQGTLQYCENQAINLSDALPEMTNQTHPLFEFYESQQDFENNSPIADFANYLNNNHLETILVVAIFNNCTDTEIINLVENSLPEANELIDEICDTDQDGVILFNLNQYIPQISSPEHTITFYRDELNTIEIIDFNLQVQNEIVIYVVVSNGICESYTTLTLRVKEIEERSISGISICSETAEDVGVFDLNNKQSEIAMLLGTSTDNIQFYLSSQEAINHQNPISLNFQNATNPQLLYASDVNSDCPIIYSFELLVSTIPDFNPVNHYVICPDSSIVLSAGPGFDSYLWSTGETTESIEVEEEGIYEIRVGLNNCFVTKTIEIEISSLAVYDLTFNENSVFVNVISGAMPFQFSLDGISWTNSSFFENLANGYYTLFVKDQNSCITSRQFSISSIAYNFLTPNGDGLNDFISFKKQNNDIHIQIYDRYGKLIFMKEFNDTGAITWNGRINGNPLPTGTYYFLISNQNTEPRMGYITLKNQ